MDFGVHMKKLSLILGGALLLIISSLFAVKQFNSSVATQLLLCSYVYDGVLIDKYTSYQCPDMTYVPPHSHTDNSPHEHPICQPGQDCKDHQTVIIDPMVSVLRNCVPGDPGCTEF